MLACCFQVDYVLPRDVPLPHLKMIPSMHKWPFISNKLNVLSANMVRNVYHCISSGIIK